MNDDNPAPASNSVTFEWTPTPEGGAALVERVPDRSARPALPKDCIEEAARMGKDPVWWYERVYRPARGTPDLPPYDVPRIPSDVPAERLEDVKRDLHGWTAERDAEAKRAGIPESVRGRAKTDGIDPRVYFERHVRPRLVETTQDYARPAPPAADPGAREAAAGAWNDHLGELAYRVGLDTSAIAWARKHGMNPFRVHDAGMHLSADERDGWRPTAAMIAERNGKAHLLNFTSDVETDALRAELAHAEAQAKLWRTRGAKDLTATYERQADDARKKLAAKAKGAA